MPFSQRQPKCSECQSHIAVRQWNSPFIWEWEPSLGLWVCLPLLHLTLYNNESPVMGDRINVLIKEAQLNVELLWPELFAKALANINTGNLQSKGCLPSSSSEAVPMGRQSSILHHCGYPRWGEESGSKKGENLGNPMMIWALFFLAKPLWWTWSIKSQTYKNKT